MITYYTHGLLRAEVKVCFVVTQQTGILLDQTDFTVQSYKNYRLSAVALIPSECFFDKCNLWFYIIASSPYTLKHYHGFMLY